MDTPRRILFLQLKRIGDAVLTAPALAAARRAFPEAKLTLVLAGAAGGLAPLFGMADEVLTWKTGGLNLPLLRRLIALKPDAALDFTGNDRSAFLSLLSRAPVRAGYEKFAARPLRRRAWNCFSDASVRELHTIDLHHALVRRVFPDVAPVSDSGRLTLPPGPLPRELPPRFAVVHAGTARAEKYWPPERWAAVVDYLNAERGLPVVLTGASDPYETEHLRAIRRAAKTGVVDLSAKLTLPQLAGVIARSALALGVDTAAMHLAAAFERPQVVLYGPTNPKHWAPRHPMARVVRPETPEKAGVPGGGKARPSMEDLPVSSALAAVDDLLRRLER